MTTTPNSNYNPLDHVIKIKAKDGTMKDYLPANWRLYELRLRHPHITLESEIVHMDVEQNLVIVKAWIFDGKTYAESECRASAYKQGQLSALDKLETAAKARAARDFGVSTELALESEPEEDLDTPSSTGPQGSRKAATRRTVETGNAPRTLPAAQQMAQPPYRAIYDEGVKKGAWTRETFYATASGILDGFPVNANNVKALSQEQLQKLQRDVERYQAEKAS